MGRQTPEGLYRLAQSQPYQGVTGSFGHYHHPLDLRFGFPADHRGFTATPLAVAGHDQGGVFIAVGGHPGTTALILLFHTVFGCFSIGGELLFGAGLQGNGDCHPAGSGYFCQGLLELVCHFPGSCHELSCRPVLIIRPGLRGRLLTGLWLAGPVDFTHAHKNAAKDNGTRCQPQVPGRLLGQEAPFVPLHPHHLLLPGLLIIPLPRRASSMTGSSENRILAKMAIAG
ncbi:hypothetical protein MTY_2674 [Moorella thermoacetica Y72]|uniref:Uncharacterized protein n=1 Tax=Moorella thermoacetica Y72 TaxID=1325331 RepID=A0A0S6UEX4_NEOTH|nr:hypothetical protein MTY_2674 [Moorella thermoacetica Y72]